MISTLILFLAVGICVFLVSAVVACCLKHFGYAFVWGILAVVFWVPFKVTKDRGHPVLLAGAVEDGATGLLQVAVFLGSDVNAKNVYDYGETLLHIESGKGHTETVKALLAAGADVHAKRYNGNTPLHEVSGWSGCAEIAKALLVAGADVHAKNESGETPLHEAAEHGNTKTVKVLLAAGADVNAKTNDGDTPLDHAVNGGRRETAELLRKNGGKTSQSMDY